MAWTKLPNLPKNDGKYILAHRGTAIVTDYIQGLKFGFQDGWDFGPTHWMKLPDISKWASFSQKPKESNRYIVTDGTDRKSVV